MMDYSDIPDNPLFTSTDIGELKPVIVLTFGAFRGRELCEIDLWYAEFMLGVWEESRDNEAIDILCRMFEDAIY